MYNLILVDDEEEVRKGILNKIDWDVIGFRVLGEAANGLEALEIFKQNKDFGSVETFSNILCNFESLKFYLEFDHENAIAYSFECNKETEHYALKDSGFFTLLK